MNAKDKLKKLFKELAKMFPLIIPYQFVIYGYIDYQMSEDNAQYLIDIILSILKD